MNMDPTRAVECIWNAFKAQGFAFKLPLLWFIGMLQSLLHHPSIYLFFTQQFKREDNLEIELQSLFSSKLIDLLSYWPNQYQIISI